MDVSAKITGIRYKPFLCRDLNGYDINEIENALATDSTFILKVKKKAFFAVSHWVSPKRTRSYPYARIYDTLGYECRHVTIIPVMKDEGINGDRDFLQWDTISLMSLLGVYTIISYYSNAERSTRDSDKITSQVFDIKQVTTEMFKLLEYKSGPLHWNVNQVARVGDIGVKALKGYKEMSKKLGIEMHSEESAQNRIVELLKGKEIFMELSRKLAEEAQNREIQTIQPKEKLSGEKARLTIRNYLGGCYFFTCDEAKIEGKQIYLIEGKHSGQKTVPSIEDIKDGLIKMILFTNLTEVKVDDSEYTPVSMLKLTSDAKFVPSSLTETQLEHLRLLKEEAKENKFDVHINEYALDDIEL